MIRLTKKLYSYICRVIIIYSIARQIYLLTPMDRATLPHAESTISRCTPSVITRQQASRAIFQAHCYTERQLSVISTYQHAEAQTLLGRFVVDILYKHVCNKYSDKSIRWSLSLSVSLASISLKVRTTEFHRLRHCCSHLTAFTYYEETKGNAKYENCCGPSNVIANITIRYSAYDFLLQL